MPQPQPHSFRRILLFRMLLLSIPILLLGQYITVRKARSSLLETARANLTTSAIRKAEHINDNIHSFQSNLQTLTQTTSLQTGDLGAIRQQLNLFSGSLPFRLECMQLIADDQQAPVINSCPTQAPIDLSPLPWLQSPASSQGIMPNFYFLGAGPSYHTLSQSQTEDTMQADFREGLQALPSDYRYAELAVTLAAPVYQPDGQLRYTLVARAVIPQLENTSPLSLVGDTVVINQEGRFLLHPDPNKVGKLFQEVGDAARFESIFRNAQGGQLSTVHLFRFIPGGGEWLAGFSGVTVPTSPTTAETWSILAVTPLDNALNGLEGIKQVLIMIIMGLIVAHGFLALYVARGLSLPIERLSHYAREVQDLSHLKEAPRNFKIGELDSLASVLTAMMKRLDEKARELKDAWQDAELANQLKSEFLATTSHELRTPLNAIIGCIRLVRDGSCDDREEELEFLDRADQAALHLLQIIDDILNIAKIESGTMVLQLDLVNLRQVIAEVLNLQLIHAQQKGLRLLGPEGEDPIWVRADRNRLRQVIVNVTYNAIKFTEQGHVTISLDVKPNAAVKGSGEAATATDLSELTAILQVQDTGIGIAPDQQAKLFRPFVMVDGSTTRRHEGTGLGLAISKNLMHLMQGDIQLKSDGLNQGTTVTITLPVADTSEPPANLPMNTLASPTSHRGDSPRKRQEAPL